MSKYSAARSRCSGSMQVKLHMKIDLWVEVQVMACIISSQDVSRTQQIRQGDLGQTESVCVTRFSANKSIQ